MMKPLTRMHSTEEAEIHQAVSEGRFPLTLESLNRWDRHLTGLWQAKARTGGHDLREFHEETSGLMYRAVKHLLRKNPFLDGSIFMVALSPSMTPPIRLKALHKCLVYFLKRPFFRMAGLAGALRGWFDFHRRPNPSSLFFFFPFCCVGGADKVHAEIIKSVADKRPWIYFTNPSKDRRFRHLFAPHAVLKDVPEKVRKPGYAFYFMHYLASFIRRHQEAVLFGCNSCFFYDLIPLLGARAEIIDLVHAFSGPDGTEAYSLPHVPRIQKRVVINNKTLDDFRALYKERGMDEKYLERLVLIENRIDVPPARPEKPINERLKILFVGRGTGEKRLPLVGRIAEQCRIQGIAARFELVGDVMDAVPESLRQYCHFRGVILDQEQLNRAYVEADLLLLTSSREGFPLVIMEAMAQGAVPLSTRVGGIPFHLRHNENGLLIDGNGGDRTVQEAVSLIGGLAGDRGRLRTLSENAYVYAREHFASGDFYEKYRALLLRSPSF